MTRLSSAANAPTRQQYKAWLKQSRPALQAAYRDYSRAHNVAAIIFPTKLLPARPIGHDDEVEPNSKKVPTFGIYLHNTRPATTAGVPGMSLPVGLTSAEFPVGLPATETVQFGSEMAAPVFRNVDPNWHRSDLLHKECEWKQGVPAAYQIRQANKEDAVAPLARSTLRVSRLQNLPGKANATGICLPPVGRQPGLWSPRSKIGAVLDTTKPSHGSRDCKGAARSLFQHPVGTNHRRIAGRALERKHPEENSDRRRSLIRL